MHSPMFKLSVLVILPVAGILFCPEGQSQSTVGALTAHSEQTQDSPRTSTTAFDEIANPAERQAFRTLTETSAAAESLRLSEAFLAAYPRSWVLAQVYALAARAAMEVGDYDRASRYASDSLKIFPEDAALLAWLADLQARRGLLDSARQNARESLSELDRFIRPASVTEQMWPQVERQLRATCYFSLARAGVSQAVAGPPGAARDELLRSALADLMRAGQFDAQRAEIPYLAGLAYLSLQNPHAAASEFAFAYKLGGPLQSRALQHLKQIYDASPAERTVSFQAYVQQTPPPAPEVIAPSPTPSTAPLPAYAGSTACRECHPDVYESWAHTGMARMLRPYRPENVIGDFSRNNKFYFGDDSPPSDPAQPAAEPARRLFARMIVDQGRHYFEINQTDGWHRYPIDYTIGSKWEQAYATRLANGEIHVFPVQYNLVQKRWLNFWKTLDAPGSPRTDLGQWQNLDIYTSYQANCAACHTSQLRNVNNGGLTPNGLVFREPGIDCEMCHGPSAQHVASIHEGKPYAKRPSDPPVDFSKISAAEFVAICAQCHEQSAVRRAGPRGELNYSTTGQFYQNYKQRPLAEFVHKAFYKDGRFRGTSFIVEAMRRSECFKKGNITCGNCHDPHAADAASNPTSLRFRARPDQMCLQCHAQFSSPQAMEQHTHHPARSEGSRCVSCHMPRIMDALLFEARSHQIGEIPDADMTLRFGQKESPNACLLCHTNQSASWVKNALLAWDGHSTASARAGAAAAP